MTVRKVAFRRNVLHKIQKAADLEVHISVVTMDGTKCFDIRDFVMSTKTYGRGVTLPFNMKTIQALIDTAEGTDVS